MTAASFATDRSLRVPAGRTVVTGYVGVWKCQLANRERMAVGDVAGAFAKLLQLARTRYTPARMVIGTATSS